MFKVVDDQLKVAQGWVRCGQCGEVFDASLHLVPGETGGPGGLVSAPDPNNGREQPLRTQQAPPMQPPSGFPDDLAENPSNAVASEPSITPEPADPVQDALAKEKDVRVDPADVEPVWQSLPQEADAILINAPPEPQGRQDPVFTANAYGFKLTDTEPAAFAANEPEVPPSPAEEPEATPEVAFVRQARQNDFWKSPLVRALLGLMGLALLAALMLQWVVRQKDVLAAQEPRLAPMLQALCRPLGCEVRPLRRIESLVIENASFSKTGPDAYRLSFVFRNTGDAALEIPALEVTLIDSQDQVLVRRVVMPAQFGATAITLAAHSELAGTLSLKVSSGGAQGASSPAQAGFLPVAGYRILAFYP